MPAQKQELSTRVALQQAQKSAEALFESRSIADIKKVEAQTRKNIEEKKHQIRQLVGDSYCDLISSADMVVSMAQTCQSVTDDITHIQNIFNDLARTLSSADGKSAYSDSHGMTARQSELYAIGNRVKFLMDTPETIWGLLDNGHTLSAARRYLCAECVHRCITGAKQRLLRRQFPLLKGQWQQVDGKRDDILKRAQEKLSDPGTTGAEEVAEALATICLLTGSGSADVLALFLRVRKDAVLALTRRKEDASMSPAAAATARLTQLAAVLQTTMHLVKLLFMPAALSSLRASMTRRQAPTLLASAVMDGRDAAAELMFEPLYADENANGAESRVPITTEGDTWAGESDTLFTKLPALDVDETASVCAAWLSNVAEVLSQACSTLFGGLGTCGALASVAANARRAFAEWRVESPSTAKGPGTDLTWDAVARTVLGRTVDVWDAVFETALVAHAQLVVDRRFSEAVDVALAPFAEGLAAADAAMECAGAVHTASAWSRLAGESESVPVSSPRRASAAAASAAAAAATDTAAWRGCVDSAASALDEGLRGALDDVMALLVPHASGTSGYSGRSSRAASDRRAEQLQNRVQSACTGAMTQLADKLGSLLAAIPPSDKPAVIEQTLILGRLADAVAHESAALPVVLGAPAAWPSLVGHARGYSSFAGSASSRRTNDLTRLAPVREAFEGVMHAAFKVWSKWAAASVCPRYMSQLSAEPSLRATADPSSWQVTLLTQTEDELAFSDDAGAISFKLPADAVTATNAFLISAARELQRVGGTSCPAAARAALAFELHSTLLERLTALLRPDAHLGSTLSEKGALQLLFDVRTLRDAFASASPATTDATAAADSVAALQRAADGVISDLSGRLDPIDWATYEPFLWPLVAAAMRRKGVLLGLLFAKPPQLELDSKEKPVSAPTESELAYLGISAACQRLPLLPISMPHIDSGYMMRSHPGPARILASTTATRAPTARIVNPVAAQTRITAALAGGPAAMEPSMTLPRAGLPLTDLVDLYSFSNINLAKPLEGHDLAPGYGSTDGQSVASAAYATLESLGAKFSDSATTAFGGGIGLSAVQEQLGTFSNVLEKGGGMFSGGLFSGFGSSKQST